MKRKDAEKIKKEWKDYQTKFTLVFKHGTGVNITAVQQFSDNKINRNMGCIQELCVGFTREPAPIFVLDNNKWDFMETKAAPAGSFIHKETGGSVDMSDFFDIQIYEGETKKVLTIKNVELISELKEGEQVSFVAESAYTDDERTSIQPD